MKQPQKPLWRKSMLDNLNIDNIFENLSEISGNGDYYGYERDTSWNDYKNESGYYQEYKELFDELSVGAYDLEESMRQYRSEKEWLNIHDIWDDMTVALLGKTQKILGFDAIECDYYGMLDIDEKWAQEECVKRIERLTKHEMIRAFREVMVSLTSFFDIKAAHDCLTSIVEELDYRGALLQCKNNEINQLYKDLTGKNGAEFDQIIANIPQRMWVE